jgi:hypothetical protein
VNGKPIPLPPRLTHASSSATALVAVESVIDYLNLPTSRPPVEREDGVHVIVRNGDELARWVYALGGEVQHTGPLGGAALWTLRTRTPRRTDGSSVEMWVHVALVAGEFAPAEFRGAEPA